MTTTSLRMSLVSFVCLAMCSPSNGRIRLAIRDLDQTVIGNPANDLIRLALSLATAIRGSDLPGATTALVLEEMMAGYAEALQSRGKKHRQPGAPPGAVNGILERSFRRRWHHLAEERIEDVSPKIPFGKSFRPLSPTERKEIYKIFKEAEIRRLINNSMQEVLVFPDTAFNVLPYPLRPMAFAA